MVVYHAPWWLSLGFKMKRTSRTLLLRRVFHMVTRMRPPGDQKLCFKSKQSWSHCTYKRGGTVEEGRPRSQMPKCQLNAHCDIHNTPLSKNKTFFKRLYWYLQVIMLCMLIITSFRLFFLFILLKPATSSDFLGFF